MRLFGSATRQAVHARWLLLSLAAVCLALMMGLSGGNVAHVAVAHADSDQGTLKIVSPHSNPSSGLPEGPAGANLRLQIQNAAHNQTYSLGYAPSGAGACASGTPTALASPASVTTDGQGGVTFASVWPTSATVGQFVVCATPSDSSQTTLTSMQTFKVDSTSPPAIQVQAAPNPAATIPAGTTGGDATPGSGSTFSAGDHVVISGSNFWPAGTSINIYFTPTANAQNTSQLGRPVSILSNDVNPTNSGGDFSVTVVIPGDEIGQVYVYAASNDGSTSDGSLPTDLASQQITVVQPTPTPTATATPTPDPTPTIPATTTTTGSGDGGVGHGLAIAGLGTLSVLLLVIGSMLLISAGRRPGGMG